MGARAAKDRPIAGNSRDGKLWSTNIDRRYIGDRRVAGGKFETRWFNGTREVVIRNWQAWLDEGLREANMVVPATPRARKGDGQMAATQQAKQAIPTKMYVITFRGQRSSKSIALYANEDAALRTATALTAALEVTGVDGEYDVTELPVWE